MELRQLKSFCLIAEYGTIKDAAERSFRTPPAICLQIQQLERELGTKLLERIGRKFKLTPQGESFYHDAQKILDIASEACERARTQAGDFTGHISLAAPACLRSFYLPAIARFRATYPTIRLTVFARSHSDVPSVIHSGKADLGMGLFDQSLPDLEVIPLVAPKLVLIVPPGLQLKFRKRILIKELSAYPLVMLQPSTTTRRIIDAAFHKANLRVRLGMEASTCTEVKRYVANDIGLGIIHNICSEAEDATRFQSINVEKIFRHPEAKLVFRQSKKLTVAEKILIEFFHSLSRPARV